MATFEKRGYIKEYDVTGKLLSKEAKTAEYKEEEVLLEEEDLFGDE